MLDSSLFASLLLCDFALNRIVFTFAVSADCSLASAATTPKLARGDISRVIRCKNVISADTAG